MTLETWIGLESLSYIAGVHENVLLRVGWIMRVLVGQTVEPVNAEV